MDPTGGFEIEEEVVEFNASLTPRIVASARSEKLDWARLAAHYSQFFGLHTKDLTELIGP